MKLFFYHRKVLLFSIELDPSNTVLEMKQKIEKTKRISVSNQTIFFKGKILLADRDSLTLTQCKIFNKSRLELYFCRSRLRHDLRQALQQTEQSPAPASTSVKDVIIIEDSPEKNQDSTLVLHQTEKALVPPSCSVDELSALEEWLMATEGNVSVQEPSWRYDNYQDWLQREQSSSTSNTFEAEAFFNPGNVSVQEPSWRNENSQDWLHRESSSSTSNIFGELSFLADVPLSTELFDMQRFGYTSTAQEQRINDQDLPASQVVHPQKRDVINIPDSPESSSKKRAKNLSTVMVLSFPVNDAPAMKFPVEVNPSENVEVLRTELAKMQQRCQLLLPEGGYFFIHKTQILYEKQSFRWNRVAQGDTIEIFPGSVTR
ncbi:BnaC09g00340D [Brassica napus]|uniref:(rape) hypothetical protein n=1 Tax=Brassica napus TaxID=3708 RepID=A0A078GB57_BRANA|nr:PREDICTED: uncharacterized protein LOC106314062 [Brassica oleracea var. oleracea]XP_013688535.1 uncharacterized protein BNAC09G00340D [Brassica napus]CAF1715405.1 unnamed protein product [Brassica napus]CDY21928.1 BnaC09g00340D [Brassica napus]